MEILVWPDSGVWALSREVVEWGGQTFDYFLNNLAVWLEAALTTVPSGVTPY